MRFVKSAVSAACISAAVLAAAAAAPAASAAPSGLPSSRVTPDPSAPGTATTFGVFCGTSATSATLFGITLGLADLILMHSTASTTAGEFVVTVTLPTDIRPGTYRPSIECSNGVSGTTTFMVNPVPGQAAPTGDGTTSTATGTPLEAIGLGLVGLGALAGGLTLRRRRAGSRT